MNRLKGYSFIFILGTICMVQSQTISLKGVVSGKGGTPINGATVTLAKQKKTVTTNAQGVYEITGVGIFEKKALSQIHQQVAIDRGILSITLTKAMPVTIELFDMKGKQLDRIVDQSVAAGDYQFNIMQHTYGTMMMALRVTTGEYVSTLSYLPLANGKRTIGSSTKASSTLAKAKAVVDTLKVSATGFSPVSVTLESLQGEKNITLDSASALEPFSFFLTSMKGLQELSKNEKGFGGDLRFGKTGQGAGILGADSICQCLAEKSMPGSKVKEWRAFLSAKKGVDGKVVNAIERIGEGPWYDRLGRLLANNKSELVADRPTNADKDIKNDLPNEYGVLNHRPDPNKPVVDNHLTITGSNSKGMLYDGKESGGSFPGMGTAGDSINGWTCDDWTSTTSKATPRAGMSWPQTMGGGMKNWISVWNMSGCEAGYDLDESTMAGKPNVFTIGNGGGYGGFYCFARKP